MSWIDLGSALSHAGQKTRPALMRYEPGTHRRPGPNGLQTTGRPQRVHTGARDLKEGITRASALLRNLRAPVECFCLDQSQCGCGFFAK